MIKRRRVLFGLLAAAYPMPALSAAIAEPRDGERRLSLLNLHTGERFQDCYAQGGQYLSPAMDQLAWVLRDHRVNAAYPIDPDLLDALVEISRKLDVAPKFNVISGYRSPRTNDMLVERSGGVVRDSLHTRGQAIDVSMQGVPLTRLRDAARAVRRGGVGYYPASGFVHVDTGRIRIWGV